MKKYTNKILVAIILIISILILSIPIAVWLFKTSLINRATETNHTTSTTEYLNYTNFNTLDVRGAWQVQILSGAFKVEISNPQDSRFIQLNKDVLTLDSSSIKQPQPVPMLIIHLPELKQLSMSGASRINVANFTQGSSDQLGLNLSGASELIISNSNYKNIKVDMSGTSNLQFKNSELRLVNLDASGVSTLVLDHFIHGKLSGSSSGLTNIRYSGILDENTLDSSGISNISGSNN